MRDRFPWIVAFAYAAVFAVLGSVRFALHRNFVDFGIFAQTSASAFGCFCNTIEGSHWAFHSSPILYVAGVLVAVWHSPFALIVLQAVVCALTIPPIYALVVAHSDRSVARWSAVVVALYPVLAGLTFGDFHENGFAPAAVAWMLWAFDAGFELPALALALVAMTIKEDQAIFIGIAGIFGAVRFRGTVPGRGSVLVALLAFGLAFHFFRDVQPHAAINPAWSPTRFYAWTWTDVRALFPGGVLERLGFFVLAFLPLLFLPFRSRMMWLAAAPLAEVLLSRMPTTFTIGSHYAGAWLGYALVAFAFAVRKLPTNVAMRALYGCAAVCCLELVVANPLHPGLNLGIPQARDRALERALATLPPAAEIATQEEAFTHLALSDPNATLLPERSDAPMRAMYVLIDRDYPDSPRLQEFGPAFQRLVASGDYRLVSRNGGIELFRSSASAVETRSGH